MRYLIVILCVIPFGGCQYPPEWQWYNRVLDSLGRIEAPLTIDTALFDRQMAGREMLDTVMDNKVIHQYRTHNNQNYFIYSRHQDSLIGEQYEYDGNDGKLLRRSRHFINGYGIVDYAVQYKKSGKAETFYTEETRLHGQYTVPLPAFTIHRLMALLKNEGLNLTDVRIDFTVPETEWQRSFGEVSYPKKNWVVKMSYWSDHHRDYASVHCREFDSDTGKVLKEWWENGGVE